MHSFYSFDRFHTYQSRCHCYLTDRIGERREERGLISNRARRASFCASMCQPVSASETVLGFVRDSDQSTRHGHIRCTGGIDAHTSGSNFQIFKDFTALRTAIEFRDKEKGVSDSASCMRQSHSEESDDTHPKYVKRAQMRVSCRSSGIQPEKGARHALRSSRGQTRASNSGSFALLGRSAARRTRCARTP